MLGWGRGGIQKKKGVGGGEDLTEPHFKNKKQTKKI